MFAFVRGILWNPMLKWIHCCLRPVNLVIWPSVNPTEIRSSPANLLSFFWMFYCFYSNGILILHRPPAECAHPNSNLVFFFIFSNIHTLGSTGAIRTVKHICLHSSVFNCSCFAMFAIIWTSIHNYFTFDPPSVLVLFCSFCKKVFFFSLPFLKWRLISLKDRFSLFLFFGKLLWIMFFELYFAFLLIFAINFGHKFLPCLAITFMFARVPIAHVCIQSQVC